MKSINEKFTDEEYDELVIAKKELMKSLGKDKLTWHDFLKEVSKKLNGNTFTKDKPKDMFNSGFDIEQEKSIW